MTQKTKNEGKLADGSSAPEIQKLKTKRKKKSIAIPKLEVDLFNQMLISSEVDATQKFTQISKGICLFCAAVVVSVCVSMLLGLFKGVSGCVSDSPKLVYFWRIRHGCGIESEESAQLREERLEPSNDNTDQMDVDWAMAIHFPEIILVDILSGLPVQSLLRFKCVDKSWETLISEPYFKMMHFNRAKNDQDSQKLLTSQMCRKNGIFSMYCCPLSPVQLVEDAQKLDCPSNPTPLRCTIHCCYDGMAVVEVPDNLNAEHSTLLLWNPSTRESIVLPSPEFSQTRTFFGLGYDSTSGEYKILQIHQGCELSSKILTLKGGSWRRIDKQPPCLYSLFVAMQFLVFVHAAFHWISISQKFFVGVSSFSISNEVYGEIPSPEEMLGMMDAIGVSVLEGMLCVHSCSLRGGENTVKLWVLKEYGVDDSWIPLLSIEDPSIAVAIPKYRFADGEVLFWCGQCPGGPFRTRSGPFGSWPQCDAILDAHAFTESLISPRSLTY